MMTSGVLADIKSEINEIKLDERYIYGEYSDVDENMAYEGALTEFLMDVNNYRNERGQKQLNLSDVIARIKTIKHKTNDVNNCFVYADFEMMMNLAPQDATPIVETSNVSTEAPQEAISETNILSAQPEDNIDEHNSNSDNVENIEIVSFNNTYNQINANILSLKMAKDVIDNLKYYKQRGMIAEMGIVNGGVVADDAFILVFEADYGALVVKQILSPVKNAKRINIMTGQADDMSNYAKGQFLWYK